MVFLYSCDIPGAVTIPATVYMCTGLWAGLHVCIVFLCGRFRVGVVNWCSVFLLTQNQWSVKTALDG